MDQYIFGARNKIHIINLEHTVPAFNAAGPEVKRLAGNKNKILFVGTRAPQARSQRAGRACRYALCQPSLAGRHAHQLQDHPRLHQAPARPSGTQMTDGTFAKLTKKEALMRTRDMEKAGAQHRRYQEHGRPA